MARPNLDLRVYREGDIDRFTPRADFLAEKHAVAWAWPEGAPPGRTWTLVDDSDPFHHQVLGVAGVFDAGDGAWQAWAILSDLTPRQWCVAGQLAEEALEGVERFNRPQSITATARETLPGAVKVLEKLRFICVRTIIDPRVADAPVYHLMTRAA